MTGQTPTAIDCPQTKSEQEDMKNVPFRNAIGKLLYLALGT